jgi:ABC-type multidrug transport system ATPase subunit
LVTSGLPFEMISLNTHSLSKRYGNNLVINGLSFEAEAPVIGIAGENGSGKSTLLKCLAGLLKPTSGSVIWKINGKVLKLQELKKTLGFLAPYVLLYEELTVFENLEFIMKLRNQKNAGNIEELLISLDASSFIHSPFGSLSTGQQQRAKLAAALVHRPQILILDEPGSNLDQKGKKSVENIIEQYRSKETMIFIASNLKHELDLCNQVVVLNNK